jgi:hypothetical protein
MDERARNKRKLGQMQEDGGSEDDDDDEDNDDDDDMDIGPVDKEKPGQGLKKKVPEDETSSKKQKVADDTEGTQQQPSDKKLTRSEKKLLNKQKKEEKKQAAATKIAAKAAAKSDAHEVDPQTNAATTIKVQEKKPKRDRKETVEAVSHDNLVKPSTEEDEVDEAAESSELEKVDLPGLVEPEDDSAATSTPSSGPNSPVFDAPESNKASVEPASTTTSISSVAPSEKPKHIKLPTDTTALRARLAAKIEALRAARKADVDGKPIRTRQELIEARREKQAQRKANKKELRRVAKVEEERKREEALASARTSPGSMLSPLVDFGDDDGSANHFAFGRVAFADGTQMSHDLTYEKHGAAGSDGKKQRKGPSDPKTALAKLEAQKKRIAGLDEDKRKEVLEKETWLAARRRAEGDKVRDDEGLLKKAVKRKEKAKKKSEREWKDRARGVENSVRERQRKREENLRKRRDEKGMKGKKKAGGGAKKKARPGFEGSFGGIKRK